MKVDHEVTVARPPEEVFAYLTDPAHLTEWQDGLLEVRREETAPVAAGSSWVELRQFRGQNVEAKVEVAEYQPPTRFAVSSVAGPVKFRVEHVLEPAGDGTLVRVHGEGEGGAVMRLAGPMIGRQVRQGFERSFAQLKQRLEA